MVAVGEGVTLAVVPYSAVPPVVQPLAATVAASISSSSMKYFTV